ncbi:MAG: ankyrin repeat domain-containing protein [Spirochaetia bacterium]|nr:ankyrin repeat domain-containing protein [Spirochaetia bacterium]
MAMITISDFTKAASVGDLDTLKEGIDTFKNIDALDQDNQTALGKAVLAGQLDAAQMLLNAKASSKVKLTDDKTIIQWAREQKDNEIAFLILLYNYMDRIAYTTNIWEKTLKSFKRPDECRYCDICSGKIQEEDSLALDLDEVFESVPYTERLYQQCLALKAPQFSNKNKKEILDYVKEQIKNNNKSDCYVICNNCIARFFQNIVYGNCQEDLVETVNEIMDTADGQEQ